MASVGPELELPKTPKALHRQREVFKTLHIISLLRFDRCFYLNFIVFRLFEYIARRIVSPRQFTRTYIRNHCQWLHQQQWHDLHHGYRSRGDGCTSTGDGSWGKGGEALEGSGDSVQSSRFPPRRSSSDPTDDEGQNRWPRSWIDQRFKLLWNNNCHLQINCRACDSLYSDGVRSEWLLVCTAHAHVVLHHDRMELQ